MTRTRLDIVGYQQEIHTLLAQSGQSTDEGGRRTLRIKSNGESFGIDADRISHIDFLQDITPLPGAQSWMLGVCHTKGRVVLVIDAAVANGGDRTSGGKLICLKGRDFAILAELDDEQSADSVVPELELDQMLLRSVYGDAQPTGNLSRSLAK